MNTNMNLKKFQVTIAVMCKPIQILRKANEQVQIKFQHFNIADTHTIRYTKT
jgi:hypothetical protein